MNILASCLNFTSLGLFPHIFVSASVHAYPSTGQLPLRPWAMHWSWSASAFRTGHSSDFVLRQYSSSSERLGTKILVFAVHVRTRFPDKKLHFITLPSWYGFFLLQRLFPFAAFRLSCGIKDRYQYIAEYCVGITPTRMAFLKKKISRLLWYQSLWIELKYWNKNANAAPQVW